jgi:hypothetical protein
MFPPLAGLTGLALLGCRSVGWSVDRPKEMRRAQAMLLPPRELGALHPLFEKNLPVIRAAVIA